jgi:hypothetical protein
MAEHERILAFYLAAARDPALVAQYREGGLDYLRDEWGFTDEDIAYIQARSQDARWTLTVWPQPPIVWQPPTVWQ